MTSDSKPDNDESASICAKNILKIIDSPIFKSLDTGVKRHRMIACALRTAIRDSSEQELRDAIDKNIRNARRLHYKIEKVAPFYRGETDAVPTDKDRIDFIINPKRTMACTDLTSLSNALKAYLPGHYPNGGCNISILHKLTLELNDKILHAIHPCAEINTSSTVLADFHAYLMTENKSLTAAEHAARVDEFVKDMQKRFCKVSDEFYMLFEARRKALRGKIGKVKKRTRKGQNLRGTRTKCMRDQLDEFKVFIKSNPISDVGQGKTIAARAKQFWAANCRHFEKSAVAEGESRGYGSADAMASACRASRI